MTVLPACAPQDLVLLRCAEVHWGRLRPLLVGAMLGWSLQDTCASIAQPAFLNRELGSFDSLIRFQLDVLSTSLKPFLNR